MRDEMDHWKKQKAPNVISESVIVCDPPYRFPAYWPGKEASPRPEHGVPPTDLFEGARKLIFRLRKESATFDRSLSIEKENQALSKPGSSPFITTVIRQGSWPMTGLPEPWGRPRLRQELAEIMLREKDKQLERVTQEMNALASRIQCGESQRRLDISYALASADARRILDVLVKKITLHVDDVSHYLTESNALNVICDLSKARLATLKGKKLIISSLGLKVAKKLQKPNG